MIKIIVYLRRCSFLLMGTRLLIFFLEGPQVDANGVRKPLIKISYKSDVWSLGCILYNLAYGKMPFGDIKITWLKLQVKTFCEC